VTGIQLFVPGSAPVSADEGVRISTSFPRFESYQTRLISLILRSALLRASRRMATSEIMPAAILRDAHEEVRSSG
jgi:hypothetical protein